MDINSNVAKISVICPSYNSAKYITHTLDSLVSQTYKPFEVLISDDGSIDDTREVIGKFIETHPDFPLRLIENPHRGPGATRNSAIKNAKGDWIAFIDSDDVWLPNKLAVVNQAIQDNFKINFFCNAQFHTHLDGTQHLLDFATWYEADKDLFSQLYRRNIFSPSAVTCKKQLLLDAGLFDEKLLSAQDYELWLRMSPKINHAYINEPLGFYNDRAGNITSTKMARRLKNILIIYSRYRSQAGFPLFVYISSRASLSIAKRSFMQFWKFK